MCQPQCRPEEASDAAPIVDNYATHTHPDLQAWLAQATALRHALHAPGASWLNVVERFFRDISENRIKRDSFTSVAKLEPGH